MLSFLIPSHFLQCCIQPIKSGLLLLEEVLLFVHFSLFVVWATKLKLHFPFCIHIFSLSLVLLLKALIGRSNRIPLLILSFFFVCPMWYLSATCCIGYPLSCCKIASFCCMVATTFLFLFEVLVTKITTFWEHSHQETEAQLYSWRQSQ